MPNNNASSQNENIFSPIVQDTTSYLIPDFPCAPFNLNLSQEMPELDFSYNFSCEYNYENNRDIFSILEDDYNDITRNFDSEVCLWTKLLVKNVLYQ